MRADRVRLPWKQFAISNHDRARTQNLSLPAECSDEAGPQFACGLGPRHAMNVAALEPAVQRADRDPTSGQFPYLFELKV